MKIFIDNSGSEIIRFSSASLEICKTFVSLVDLIVYGLKKSPFPEDKVRAIPALVRVLKFLLIFPLIKLWNKPSTLPLNNIFKPLETSPSLTIYWFDEYILILPNLINFSKSSSVSVEKKVADLILCIFVILFSDGMPGEICISSSLYKVFKFLEETSSWKEKNEMAEYNVDISLLFFCCKSLKSSSFIEIYSVPPSINISPINLLGWLSPDIPNGVAGFVIFAKVIDFVSKYLVNVALPLIKK